jgi:PAS domain-containing protein
MSNSQEQANFGSNAGACLILVSADQFSFGKILHANDETEYVLGYKRQELLDKNINTIQPYIIKVNHNRIL